MCRRPFLSLDRCEVLLAAGLVTEALTETDAAIRDIEQAHGWSTKRAELLLTAANCALAAVQPQGAIDRAEAAYRLFGSQQNTWGQAHARLVLVQARYAVGPVTGRLLRGRTRPPSGWMNTFRARQRRRTCWPGGWPWTSVGTRRPIVILQPRRKVGGAAMRWHAPPAGSPRRCERRPRCEPGRMLAACRRGLEVLDDHRLTLGASELRAQATARGGELATLAQRHSVQARRPADAARLDRTLASHRADRARRAALRGLGTQRRSRRAT